MSALTSASAEQKIKTLKLFENKIKNCSENLFTPILDNAAQSVTFLPGIHLARNLSHKLVGPGAAKCIKPHSHTRWQY